MSANVTTAPSAVPEVERALVAVTAGIAAVVNTLSGAGTGGDVQTLVALGSVSCAHHSLRDALSDAAWCLTPVAFGPSDARELFGSFAFAIGCIVAHFLALCVVASQLSVTIPQLIADGSAAHLPSSVLNAATDPHDPLLDPEVRSNLDKLRWRLAGEKVLYPSLTYLLVMFFFQGLALRAFEMFAKSEETFGRGLAMSLVAAIFALAMVFGLVLFVWRYFRAVYVPYVGVYQNYNRWVARIAFPAGFWGPRGYTARFGAIFWCFRGGRHVCAPMVWVRMTLIAAIAAVESVKGNTCSAQFAAFGVVCALYAALVVALRPLRSLFANGVCALSNLLISLVALSGYLEWEAMPKALLAITSLSLLSGVLQCVFLWKELMEWRPAEELYAARKAAAQSSASGASTPSQQHSRQVPSLDGRADGDAAGVLMPLLFVGRGSPADSDRDTDDDDDEAPLIFPTTSKMEEGRGTADAGGEVAAAVAAAVANPLGSASGGDATAASQPPPPPCEAPVKKPAAPSPPPPPKAPPAASDNSGAWAILEVVMEAIA